MSEKTKDLLVMALFAYYKEGKITEYEVLEAMADLLAVEITKE